MKGIDFKSYDSFNHYIYNGKYAVRTYYKSGKGMSTAYMDTFEEATFLRTAHGIAIGLEPEPTYKDFALYPTIWKWDFENNRYERILGY